MSRKRYWVLFSSIIVLSSVLLLFRLGTEPFVDYDEASYASIIVSTANSSDITAPLMVDKPSFEKPPLYYWLSMASEKVFGDKEFSYRFPSVFFAILGVALVMLIVLETSGSYGASLFAGLILLSSGLYFESARQLRLDVPVTVCILVSVFSFLKGSKKAPWLLGIGIGLGLAIMMKSVIGLLVIPIVILWSICAGNWQWIKNRYTWMGAVACAAIVLPWHIRESLLFGQAFWDQYLGVNVLKRVSSNIMNNQGGISYYIRNILWSLLPWSIVLLAPFVSSVRSIVMSGRKVRENLTAGPTFVAIAIFLVFLMSQTKLMYYFVPAVPFVAIAIALFAHRAFEAKKLSKMVAAISVVCLLIVGGVMIWFAGYDKDVDLAGWVKLSREERDVGQIIASEPDTSFYVFQYPYAETLRYYSGNKTELLLTNGTKLDKPMLVVMPASVFVESNFPPDLFKHMTVKYKGRLPLLVRIQ